MLSKNGLRRRASNDRVHGDSDRLTSPRSPWQNGHAERLIGSIRRECLDYVVVFGERHLRHVLLSYMNYYNETRTHLSLENDAPLSRTVQRAGRILRLPILGGLHHQYVRMSAPLRVDIDALTARERAELAAERRRKPGQRSLATIAGIAERDDLLRHLAKFYPGLSRHAQAEQISLELRRYEAAAWQRERRR
jgi:hypothetical protein